MPRLPNELIDYIIELYGHSVYSIGDSYKSRDSNHDFHTPISPHAWLNFLNVAYISKRAQIFVRKIMYKCIKLQLETVYCENSIKCLEKLLVLIIGRHKITEFHFWLLHSYVILNSVQVTLMIHISSSY